MPRPLALLLLVLTLPVLSGCSLLGLAVGSQIPRYQPIEHATRGDALYLVMADGEIVRGAAVEIGPSSVTVLTDERDRVVDTKQVKKLARRRGSEWLSTFLIGLAVDATLGAFGLLAASVHR